MTDRVDKAYETLHNALQDLVDAIDEEDGWTDAGTVADYVVVVGQQRFTGKGRGRDGEPYMLLPFGSQPEYVTNGLLSKVPELLSDVYSRVVVCEDEETE